IDVEYQKMGADLFAARGCDDKAGAFIVAEVMRELSKKKLNVCVSGVATVQEEVGLRGAITSSYTVKPDVGIAIDVGFATDHPESEPKKVGEVALGKGPVLHRGPNINPILEADLFKTAKRLKIAYQVTGEPRATGTDANALQLSRGGAATALLSLPNRYMHTPVEMLSLTDLENSIKLLAGYIAKMPAKRDFRP
ncbi:MAG: M20/M25/M40 family metallo-hydrolase, partial [Phycisphaerae bacterium]|nr:M20/M25/M40 family metallo-hydrolase [Phycisphaerae bacterium]